MNAVFLEFSYMSISFLSFFLSRYIDHRALDGGTEGLNQAATILDTSRHILKRNGSA